MSARAAAGLLVSALIRQVEAAGGQAMVLAKGDATAGAIIVVVAHRGETLRLFERAMRLDGAGHELRPVGPASFDDPFALTDYVARRRKSDPDLWVVELDAPDAESMARALLAA